jgi:hypothetical protein
MTYEEAREKAALSEHIYEPKCNGKDHSGYETMMKYEINDERAEAFSNGADWCREYFKKENDELKADLATIRNYEESTLGKYSKEIESLKEVVKWNIQNNDEYVCAVTGITILKDENVRLRKEIELCKEIAERDGKDYSDLKKENEDLKLVLSRISKIKIDDGIDELMQEALELRSALKFYADIDPNGFSAALCVDKFNLARSTIAKFDEKYGGKK